MIPWIRQGECHVCFSNSLMIEWVLKIWSRFSWVYTRSELEFWFTLWAPNSCRYETVVKRWPIILTGIVDQLHRDCHDLTMEAQKHNDEPSKRLLEEKITEAKDVISRISKLKYQMGGDKKLQWVLSSHWLMCCIYLRYRGTRRPILDDNEANIEVYNTELAKLDQNGQGSWFTAPWLYAEWIYCYFALICPLTQPISDATCSCASRLHTDVHSHNDAARYRYIRSYLSQSSHWKFYDPFFSQKQATLQGSGEAIYSSSIHRSQLAITFSHSFFLKKEIATTFHELDGQKDALENDLEKLEVLFKEMIQMSLWWVIFCSETALLILSTFRGNATVGSSQWLFSSMARQFFAFQDLSLLTHLTPEDISHLQSVGKEAQQAQKKFILRDDQEAVWSHLKGLKHERIDFVLDNGKQSAEITPTFVVLIQS